MLEEKEYSSVIKELEEFRDKIVHYFKMRSDSQYDDSYSSVSAKVKDDLNRLRQEINQKIPIIKHYFKEINLSTVLHDRAPAVVGGISLCNRYPRWFI